MHQDPYEKESTLKGNILLPLKKEGKNNFNRAAPIERVCILIHLNYSRQFSVICTVAKLYSSVMTITVAGINLQWCEKITNLITPLTTYLYQNFS